MKNWLTYLFYSVIVMSCYGVIFLYGCSGHPGWFPKTSTMEVIPNEAITAPVASCSPMLSWLGGLCTLSGMALLVLTGGKMGWRPLLGGIAFVVINYALAMYASWIFLPVVIATGAISLAWAGKIVWKIVNDDEIKIKEIF